MKLYVGNLPFSLTEDGLKDIFGQFNVVKATLIVDKMTGRSKGYGFVETESKEDGDRAIRELNKKEINGRAILVNEALPQKPRTAGGPGGGSSRFSANGNSRSRY